jgi:hypothetical protein
MRGLALSLSHLSPILFSWLVLCTPLLWAQRKWSLEGVQLFDTPAQLTTFSEAQTHLQFAYTGFPPSFGQNQGQSESLMRHDMGGDYRLPNSKAVLDQAPRTVESRGKENYFIGRAASKWLTFAPTYGKVHREAMYGVDELEYYGHHIPWVGSLIERICQQAKVHPHVARVFEVLHPQF